MNKNILIQGYCDGFYEVIAANKDDLSSYQKDVDILLMAFTRTNIDTIQNISDIVEREKVVMQILDKLKTHKIFKIFLKILTDKNYLFFLPSILKSLHKKINADLLITDAYFYANFPLEEDLQKKLEKSLSSFLSLKVNIIPILEEKVEHGFIIETGDHVFDYSLSGRIERAKAQILEKIQEDEWN